MKKSVKIILTVIVVIIGLIVLDTIQARVLKNSPIISWKENLEDADSWVDRGILMDTYYCTEEQDIVTISWKFKTSKFTCPIDNVSIDELNNINAKIIEYFLSTTVPYDNYSYNYVDEENNVVIVGLLDNSKEEQDKFRKLIVDSEYIKFVKGERLVNEPTITDEEVNNIQDKIINNVSTKDSYTNFAACYVDTKNKVVVVELVDNSREEQEWFRNNILNSQYIKFVQGGPYTTSDDE